MSQPDPAPWAALTPDSQQLKVTELVAQEGLKEALEVRLTAVLAEQRAHLNSISTDANHLVEAWTPMLQGGKRIRAAFAYWAWRAYGGDHTGPLTPAIIRIGAALELFQAAALFHDDVMDRSDTRRGIPTAHRAFATAHKNSESLGDGEQYGLSAAILLGDLSLVASENEFRGGSRSFDPLVADRAHKHFDDMRTVVTVGQFLDVHAQVAPWEDDLAGAEARALTVIETKTASYSVNSPLQIGASFAGISDAESERLKAFGIPVGMAYQLVDDVLGMFGDQAVTGKPSGDDLKEGKRTVLVIEALRVLGAADRTTLQNALGNPNLTDAEVASLIALIKDSGAVEATLARVQQLSHQGLEALAQLDMQESGRSMLYALTQSALRRLS